MKQRAIFYHAGCPVCVSAEESVLRAVDATRYDVSRVHLGESKDELARARSAGVKSVPALVIEDQVFHINHGADLADLG